MKYALAALLSLSMTLPVWADNATRDFSNLNGVPLTATALVNDSSAIAVNPGGGGAEDIFDLYLSQSLNPNNKGQFNAFMGLPYLSLGYQQFQTDILGDLRKFTVGYTYPVMDYFTLGGSYHFTSQLNGGSDAHSFDLGAQIRPARFLSFGVALRNLNAPLLGNRSIQRAYALGVGVRPFGEQLTLTADVQWDEGDEARQITGLFGLEAEPADGILVRSSIDTQGQFMLGLGMNFNVFSAGYFHGFNAPNTTKATDAAHIKVTNALFENTLQSLGNHFAYIDMRNGLALDNGATANTFGGPTRSFWQFLEQMERVAQFPRYKGVILDLGKLPVGMGAVEELRQAMQKIRQSGKQVIVYIQDAGMKELYLSADADKVVMHPLGSVEFGGLSYVLPHYRELLDKVGVQVDFIRVGKYKTGMESYVSKAPAPETVEQYSAIQKSAFLALKEALIKERQLNDTQFQRVLDKTLFTSQEAKEMGLVDRVGYRDELKELAANLTHQPSAKLELLSAVRVHDPSWEPLDRVAVVYVSGSIVSGSSGRDLIFGEQFAGSDTIVKEIREVQRDPRIKAMVVRINSPGGSALASDEIYRALMQYKEKTKNPVIVSMGDIAASGGYWIAMAGDKVYANPNTLTGSIGIYAGKTSFQGLYDKLGIHNAVIKTNEKADSRGNHRPYSADERQVVQNHMRDYYRVFLERVADNRNMGIEEVAQIAQGRVYSGQQAFDLKLVDALGGLNDALEQAKAKATIVTSETEILHRPDFTGLMGQASLDKVARLAQPDSSIWESGTASITRLFPSQYTALALVDPRLSALLN